MIGSRYATKQVANEVSSPSSICLELSYRPVNKQLFAYSMADRQHSDRISDEI